MVPALERLNPNHFVAHLQPKIIELFAHFDDMRQFGRFFRR